MDESSISKYPYYYWHQEADDSSKLLGEEELISMTTIPGGSEPPLDDDGPPPPAIMDSNKQQQQQGDEQAEEEEEEEPHRRRRESMMNKLISTVYSGPTISDIESALSFTGAGDHHHQLKYNFTTSPSVVFSPEKVLSKMENKYTLKIKTCGGNNGLAEDGYKWRKYGQKSIKNSPNPRSYYRCTNPRCNAKKQVERATDEPDTLLVTYEGLHLHYTYSHFLHAAQVQQQQGLPKKPKRGPAQPPLLVMDDHHHQKSDEHGAAAAAAAAPSSSWYNCFHNHEREDEQQQQQHMNMNMNAGGGGLLEDVVPLLVRRPCGSASGTTASSSNNYSPPSPSTSSVCWTPTSPAYIDMAILSNIF